MMIGQTPKTERKTDRGYVATYDKMHNMAFFVVEERDVPSGHNGDMNRISHLDVRRVVRPPFEKIDHDTGLREIEEVQIGMMISMIGPKRTNTAYGSISLRGDQIDQLIAALQEVQVAKGMAYISNANAGLAEGALR
jgi:hypothetical protein